MEWLDSAIELASIRDIVPADFFDEHAEKLEGDFEGLLGVRATTPANQKMFARLTKWQDAVLRCLRDPRIPATNNHVERQIRPAVVTRKRGGCNRTHRGARAFEALTSHYITARQHGVDFVQWLTDPLRQPESLAARPFWLIQPHAVPAPPRSDNQVLRGRGESCGRLISKETQRLALKEQCRAVVNSVAVCHRGYAEGIR